MKKSILLISLLSFIVGLSGLKKVRLATTEWAPYSGKELDGEGAFILIVKEAFRTMEYEVDIDFYPWERTVYLAEKDSTYDGYLPEYYSAERAENFYFSNPVCSGPLGFAERKDDPIEWETLEDLKKYNIGTVKEYVNTEDFDIMLNGGEFKSERALNDLMNLKKIIKGRVDCAVIDKFVLQYFLKYESDLKESKDLLQFNEKILENRKIYVCFSKKTKRGKELTDVFNLGLEKIKVESLLNDYIKKYQ
ncbi:MAG: ABC transporter [Candidatus Cloacimonadota bacterium]|nr:MAG: ABC transporter [Candidatus Cloacimonadota bacterium]